MGKEKKPFLSVKNLTVEYRSQGQDVHAVNGVSFDLEEGETLGLVGETGAGKTSTAKAILRVLPDVGAKIKDGEVFLEGEDLLKLSEKKMQGVRGNKISMIFQDPMSALNPVQTIVEQVAEPIRFHNKVSRAEATARAIKMLELVGITPDRVREYPHQFSGGMRQRAVIAIALACEPKLLLADEPTTALDVTIQAQVLDLISELRKQFHTAMLLITHDLGVVGEVCDKVAVIYAGEIVEYGDKVAVYDHPNPSLHRRALCVPAGSGKDRRTADTHRGDAAEPDGSAGRLHVPSPVPLCDKRVQRAAGGTFRGGAGPLFQMSEKRQEGEVENVSD